MSRGNMLPAGTNNTGGPAPQVVVQDQFGNTINQG